MISQWCLPMKTRFSKPDSPCCTMATVSVPVRHRAAPLWSAVVLASSLAGCATLAPDYHRPAMPTPAQWREQPGSSDAGSGAAAELGWRDLFADPGLREVIQLALDNNRDLRVAALNIEKARAQYRIQRAELIPSIAVSASETAQRTPASVSYTGVGGVSRAYALDVGLSAYELDLFGRVRSLKDEALQTYLATGETRRATHISLVAQVASSYMTLAADLQLQQLAGQTLSSRQQAYDLQAARAETGTASALELRQAESELESARNDALAADQQVALDRNALELLLGAQLPQRLVPAPSALQSMLAIRQIPAGLPADLLYVRPDILAAEHTLRAANADIGAARAAFFPSITLTTNTGRASDQLSALFDHGGRSWSFVPQLSLPIFSGGRLRAQLEVSKVERDIAVAQYEQSIQNAFREVADALAERSVVDEQAKALQRSEAAAKASNDLATLRYENGVSGYLEVLDAQRTLYAAQQALVQAQLARQTSVVALYRALGGGWMPTS
jgi:outer membrane protein, multidrug efflux system